MIERYDWVGEYEFTLGPMDDGDWVRWSDVEQMARELEARCAQWESTARLALLVIDNPTSLEPESRREMIAEVRDNVRVLSEQATQLQERGK